MRILAAIHPPETTAVILECQGIDGGVLVLHADNGGPMKGGTMLSTMERLGVAASFSRSRLHERPGGHV